MRKNPGINPWLQTYERAEIKIGPLQSVRIRYPPIARHSHAPFAYPDRYGGTMILRCTCTFHPLHPCRTAFYLCPSAGQDVENSSTLSPHDISHSRDALLDRGTCDIGASLNLELEPLHGSDANLAVARQDFTMPHLSNHQR